MADPLVSVVLPVQNGGAYLDAAIQSVRAQDYANLEIVVIDDGSTDDTLARLQRHAREDSRVRILSRANRGLTATLNEGLGLAQGDLIARMDADDFAYPSRIGRQVEAFTEDPALGLCASGIDVLSRGRLYRGRTEEFYRTGSLPVLSLFFCVFCHPTAMFNRRVLGDTLRYDPLYPCAEDFDLFRRITASFPVHLIHDPLLVYRIHKESTTVRRRMEMQHTHLRIVGENLRQDGLEGDVESLREVLLRPSRESVSQAVAVLSELDAHIKRRQAHLRASYDAGRANLVQYLASVLWQQGRSDLARAFLEACGAWHLIRRRERLLLKVSGEVPMIAVPLMKLSNEVQPYIDWLTARHAKSPDAGLFLRS